MAFVDRSEIGRVIAELLAFASKKHRIRPLRVGKLDGKVYSRYSGAHLRRIRAINGVGRPPH